MKAIMISIRPQYVAKILNGEKTLEIRKTCPEVFKHLKPYEGASLEVYIYCCKQKKNEIGCHINYHKVDDKVVAKFTLNKVEEIYGGSFNQFDIYSGCYFVGKECPLYFEQKSCLSQRELMAYLKGKKGYAWHIDNLVIFDKPKDISEFKHWVSTLTAFNCLTRLEPLTRASQSWCYVEV